MYYLKSNQNPQILRSTKKPLDSVTISKPSDFVS